MGQWSYSAFSWKTLIFHRQIKLKTFKPIDMHIH
jgi:hypothetical protein